MGKQSREKRERREKGEIALEEKPEIRPVVSICKKLIFISTLLILLTPLIGPPLTNNFFFPFVGPKSLYFMGLAELIFFTWLFLIIIDKRFRPKFNLILLGLILFLTVSIVSAFYGVDPSYSFWSKFERMAGILMLLHLFAFFLVVSSVFKKEDWKKIFAISIGAGVIEAIIASTAKSPMMRGGGTIGNDSFLGTYLLFNLFFALCLFLKSKGGIKIYSAICFVITSLILLLSDAKAAKLSFLAGVILLFILWLIFSQRKKLKIIGASLFLLLFISGSFFVFSAFQPESFVRKGIIEKTVGETFGGRFVVWQGAWQGFLQKPLLGWGPENFEFAFTENYNPCMGTARCGADIWYDRAHNVIFDTLVTSGALGMLSYILIFLLTFYVLGRNYLRKKTDFWTAGIFTVLLISYFVQNLTVFDMISSYMIFFLILGFIAQKEIPEAETIREPRFLYLSPIFILIISLFFLSFSKFVISPLQTDAYTISALRAKPFSEERLSFYKKTLLSSPVGKYQIREFFTDSSLGSLSEKVSKENVIKEFDFLEEELKKSIKENSINYRAYLKLGQLLNTYGQIEPSRIGEVEKILNKAIEVSPTNQQGYWYLAQTKIQQGKTEEALSLAEKAVELEPNLERSHIIVIKIAAFMGNSELAEKKIKEALEINPGWENDLREILKKPG
ncbi:O-antigen ligase family protein [Patescibacteria group bacterium]|nr:O-antigen ligase family protein [Patescibacteria group bacterium]MBU4481193.1 O-antigen ligase family protein [Patescibacteria group bacterium]